jgi:hypothetical protein
MKNFESGFAHSEAQEKQALWEKTLEELDHIGDKLGRPIEDGIKEAVAAFLVNSFPTNGSCEGHVEERFDKGVQKSSPYVDIGFPEPEERHAGEREIRERIAAKHNITPDEMQFNDAADDEYWDYIFEHDIQETPEFLEIRERNKGLQKAIVELLEEFYRGREINPDTRLTVRPHDPAYYSRVTIAKHAFKEEPPIKENEIEQHKKELLAEQQEMKSLTDFLKEKFFGEKK